MTFFKNLFSSFNDEEDDSDFEDSFEFTYEYNDEGSYLENFNSGEEKHFEFVINVTIEFNWDIDKNMYEVDYHVSSPTVDYVEIPDDDEFEKDVYKDLTNKGIELDYIPDRSEWNIH